MRPKLRTALPGKQRGRPPQDTEVSVGPWKKIKMERALELDAWNVNCPIWGITTTKNNNATSRAQQQQGRKRPLGRLYEVPTRRARSWCDRRTAPPKPILGRHRALMHLKVHARPEKKSTVRCDSKKKNQCRPGRKGQFAAPHARRNHSRPEIPGPSISGQHP